MWTQSTCPGTARALCAPSRLRPAQQRRGHLPRLVAVVVNGLLPQQQQQRPLARCQRRQQLGHAQRLHLALRVHVHSAVGAHGQGRAQRLDRLLGAHAHRHHLLGHPLIL